MTTFGMNGTRAPTEFEISHASSPYAGEAEDELEAHAAEFDAGSSD